MFTRFLIPIVVSVFALFMGSCATTEDDSNDIDKYIGTWNVNDIPSRINYNVTIQANPSNSAEILLNNFADLGTAIGLVVGNSIVIDNQTIGTDYTVSGSGSYINSSKLEFTFDLNDGIDIESREAIFTK